MHLLAQQKKLISNENSNFKLHHFIISHFDYFYATIGSYAIHAHHFLNQNRITENIDEEQTQLELRIFFIIISIIAG